MTTQQEIEKNQVVFVAVNPAVNNFAIAGTYTAANGKEYKNPRGMKIKSGNGDISIMGFRFGGSRKLVLDKVKDKILIQYLENFPMCAGTPLPRGGGPLPKHQALYYKEDKQAEEQAQFLKLNAKRKALSLIDGVVDIKDSGIKIKDQELFDVLATVCLAKPGYTDLAKYNMITTVADRNPKLIESALAEDTGKIEVYIAELITAGVIRKKGMIYTHGTTNIGNHKTFVAKLSKGDDDARTLKRALDITLASKK